MDNRLNKSPVRYNFRIVNTSGKDAVQNLKKCIEAIQCIEDIQDDQDRESEKSENLRFHERKR